VYCKNLELNEEKNGKSRSHELGRGIVMGDKNETLSGGK